MKNPNELCTRAMATTIFIAIPNAAIRVRNPRINPRPPKNSAVIARKANGAGTCRYPVNMPMDPEKPGPPNHPNSFCAPCAKKTTPSTSLRIAVTLLSSVTSKLRSICRSPFLGRNPDGSGRSPLTCANCEMHYPYQRILYLRDFPWHYRRGFDCAPRRCRIELRAPLAQAIVAVAGHRSLTRLAVTTFRRLLVEERGARR